MSEPFQPNAFGNQPAVDAIERLHNHHVRANKIGYVDGRL